MDAVTGTALGDVKSTPGGTFEAIQGVPTQVKWVNNLVDASGSPLSYFLPVDPTIHWANPANLPMDATGSRAKTPVPIVTHLHGGEDQSTSDGGPDAWWTADGEHGPTYNSVTATDPNAAVYLLPLTSSSPRCFGTMTMHWGSHVSTFFRGWQAPTLSRT